MPDGIRRKVDDLGRIVIPASIRRSLDISTGDELVVEVDADRIVLGKPSERCTFCEAGAHLELFRGRLVCWSCMAAIRALDRERHDEAPANPFGL